MLLRRTALTLSLCLVLSACHSGSAPPPVCTASGDCEETFAVVGGIHVLGTINYPDPPPTGGPHNPCWAPFGVATTELHPENWVHNLEHGGVAFLYNCPLGCDAEIADLVAIAAGKPFAVVTSYSALPKRFAVVSWGHRLVTDDYDHDAFELFYAQNVDHAPESESANPPAACATMTP